MCRYLKSDIGSSSHISQNFADAVTSYQSTVSLYTLTIYCRYVFDTYSIYRSELVTK